MGCNESQDAMMEKPSGGVGKKSGGPGKSGQTKPVKLLYFDHLYARAEPIRMLLHYAGANWEDVRLTKEEFAKMKENGELPSGQLPTYIDEQGNQLNQSNAINIMIAKKYNLYGEQVENKQQAFWG